MGNNSNYCYSMDDIDSSEIITNDTLNNINFLECENSLFTQISNLKKDIKERLPQLSEQANDLLLMYVFYRL